MTQEEIIKLAHTAGFNWPDIQATTIEQRLERFAALVAAAEREKFTNTQEFVTLPREAVERALAALDAEDPYRAAIVLRAALEQPQECYDQRDPLADQQIDAIAESMPGGLDGFLKGWGWRQFARAVLEAAPQPTTFKECLTDELKPRFGAHDDAERLKSVAIGMSYNDHGEAVWKHTLMEIAVRLESGGYAAPQPPALEQQVEKESTCKDSLQVEQEPVAWALSHSNGLEFSSNYPMQKSMDAAEQMARKHMGAVTVTPLYTHPQPKREPLTDMQKMMCWSRATHDADVLHKTEHQCLMDYASEIEAAHNIK